MGEVVFWDYFKMHFAEGQTICEPMPKYEYAFIFNPILIAHRGALKIY